MVKLHGQLSDSEQLNIPYPSPPIPFKRLPSEIFMLVHKFYCILNIQSRTVMQWILSGTRGPLHLGQRWKWVSGSWVMGQMGHHFCMGNAGHGSQPVTH